MYRTTDVEMWIDDWVQTLPGVARCLFVYLITNHRITACGAFEVSLKNLSREFGFSEDEIRTALPLLAPKVQFWPEYDAVWVKNFYKRQKQNSNKDNFQVSARRAVSTLPAPVRDAIRQEYPELRLQGAAPMPNGIPQPINNGIPAPMPVTVTDNSRQITESENRAPAPAREVPPGTAVNRRPDAPRPVPKPSEDPVAKAFVEDELRQIYPLRNTVLRQPAAAYAAVARVPRAEWPALLVAARHYAAGVDGQEGYPKDVHNWIDSGEWREWLKGPGTPRPIRAGPATNGTPPGRPYTLIRKGAPP